MITSTSNQQMKNLSLLMKKAKARNEQGIFIVEGQKMAEEIPAGWLEKTYVSESFQKENEDFLVNWEYEVVSDSVFKAISDTQTPQGILCLVKKPEYELEQLLIGEDTHLLVLESIQDPGNLGTMLRTGEGAGISGVIMNQTTVDLFNPKTIRSTMGSIYRTLKERIHQEGVSNIYEVVLSGVCHSSLEIVEEKLKSAGNIRMILDKTEKKFDYEWLQEKYEDCLLGRYISSFKNCNDSIEKEALQLGTAAILEALEL